METLKIMKLKCPVSICNLLVPSLRDSNLSLRIPKVRLDLSKNNFVFNACMLWNNFGNIVFSRIIPDANGIMVPGFSKNFDLAIPISVAKNRLSYFFGQSYLVPTFLGCPTVLLFSEKVLDTLLNS